MQVSYSSNKTALYVFHKSNLPWTTALAVTSTFISIVVWVKSNEFLFFKISGSCLILILGSWAATILAESEAGKHNYYMEEYLKVGFLWFIFSELMFFVGFFWVYFDASLNPSVEIGCTWVPTGIITPNPMGIPFLNTMTLLTSAVSLTVMHYEVKAGKKPCWWLLVTILLGYVFMGLQLYEYMEASFTASDSIYGSVFYISTGFHGIHVACGTWFLTYCLWALWNNYYSATKHLSLECAILYWHFVDAVWLFLYIFVYWWGH